jgi:hypothetical protein
VAAAVQAQQDAQAQALAETAVRQAVVQLPSVSAARRSSQPDSVALSESSAGAAPRQEEEQDGNEDDSENVQRGVLVDYTQQPGSWHLKAATAADAIPPLSSRSSSARLGSIGVGGSVSGGLPVHRRHRQPTRMDSTRSHWNQPLHLQHHGYSNSISSDLRNHDSPAASASSVSVSATPASPATASPSQASPAVQSPRRPQAPLASKGVEAAAAISASPALVARSPVHSAAKLLDALKHTDLLTLERAMGLGGPPAAGSHEPRLPMNDDTYQKSSVASAAAAVTRTSAPRRARSASSASGRAERSDRPSPAFGAGPGTETNHSITTSQEDGLTAQAPAQALARTRGRHDSELLPPAYTPLRASFDSADSDSHPGGDRLSVDGHQEEDEDAAHGHGQSADDVLSDLSARQRRDQRRSAASAHHRAPAAAAGRGAHSPSSLQRRTRPRSLTSEKGQPHAAAASAGRQGGTTSSSGHAKQHAVANLGSHEQDGKRERRRGRRASETDMTVG